MSNPEKKPNNSPDTVEISKEEFEFYQVLLPDFVNILIGLQKVGETLAPILPTEAEAAQPVKPNMVTQMKMVAKVMPMMNQFLPDILKELQTNIMPICKKHESLVAKYQQAT